MIKSVSFYSAAKFIEPNMEFIVLPKTTSSLKYRGWAKTRVFYFFPIIEGRISKDGLIYEYLR